MKTTPRMSLSAALAAALLMGSVLHTQADWTRTGNTITDENGWALNVSAKTINGVAGISLNTDCVATKGTPADMLDLSGAVSDGSVIVEIGDYALRTSKAGTLTHVTLPDGVIRIGANAFQSQTSLTTITPFLPSSVKTLGSRAFSSLTALQGDLDMSSVTDVGTGDSLFRSTKITSVVLGSGLKTLISHAFADCSVLGSVVFAEGLETISGNAFLNCSALTNIVNCLPLSLKSLASGQVNTFNSAIYTGRVEILNPAFSIIPQQFGFKFAKEFVFGTGVTTVSDYAFDYVGSNSRAYDIYFRGGPPTFGTDVFRGTSDWKLRFFYPLYDDAVGGWRDWLAANTTPLTSAQTNTYVAAYPGAPLPIGRGKAGIFNNKYFVPYAPEPLATNALHVVGSVTRSIAGHGDPARDAVEPAYGVVENLADGATVDCSAPAIAVLDGTRYQCAGHVLETLGAAGWESPVTNLDSTAFTYTRSGSAARRLTWLWEPIGYTLTLTMPDLGADSVTRSVQPDAEGIYPSGTVVQLTAVSGSDAVFRQWHGDVPAGQEPAAATITLTMDSPKTLLPEFVRNWLHTAGGTATIRDGYWTIPVSVSSTTNLSLKTPSVDGKASDILDFAKPVADASGTAYQIIATENTSGTTLGNKTWITEVKLPEGMISIGQNAFSGNTGLKKINMPSTLERIGTYAFNGCSALTQVTPFLPHSVTNLAGNYLFNGCPVQGALVLTNPALVIGASSGEGRYFQGTKIETAELSLMAFHPKANRVFVACTELRQIFLHGDVPATMPAYLFEGRPAYQIRVYAPKGSESWQDFIATSSTIVAPTVAETNAFLAAYPGERLPVGLWTAPNSNKQWLCTWVPPEDQLRTTVLLVR